ncbi:hypothetical protein [Bifidobacterium sp. ESL0790]|uniref:hypothetical protein n=1 Tax=Bifidobacterium sp. ESL0790 TaxID=2983233 RepID=UPI0023F7FC8F|nr:hypothetical protein [Bifidobacterium sp. ESL0790]WEV72130.1 hypothetical protein OZY47_06735 [Bifidobacterium sp. ESL0790]
MRYHKIARCPECGGKVKADDASYMRVIGEDSIRFVCARCGFAMNLRFQEYTDSWDDGIRLQACIAEFNRIVNSLHTPRHPLASRRRCRVCGCDDLHACQWITGPCHWVEPDLCSACADKQNIDTINHFISKALNEYRKTLTALAGCLGDLFAPFKEIMQ